MFQKFTIYDTEAAHNEIGQAIHDAKRRFLDAHKKGVRLQSAAETFFAECKNVIDRAEIRLQTPEQILKREEPIDVVPLMSDERISELTGRLRRSVDSSLREMADAIRAGKCPGEAFQDVMSAFIESGRDIPQHEYDGMTHTEWWADKERRAEAIMADESGRYADSTKAAIRLVYTEMQTPGNQKKTDLGWREYGDWIKRAEAGEVLDAASEIGADENEASDESAQNDPKTKERPREDLRDDEIEHCVATLLATGCEDKPRPYALLLLLDEIAHDETGRTLSVASRAALRSGELADGLIARLISDFRPEYAHSSDRAWTIAEAVECYEDGL